MATASGLTPPSAVTHFPHHFRPAVTSATSNEALTSICMLWLRNQDPVILSNESYMAESTSTVLFLHLLHTTEFPELRDRFIGS
jgi:hypothetical protein